MKRTGGRWDPSEKNAYFIASDVESLLIGGRSHDHLLIAVNEIHGDDDRAVLLDLVRTQRRKRLFIDSGVFSLAMRHAEVHNIPHDVALATSPFKVDGFDKLFKAYCDLMGEIGDEVWGYIEIDLGGRENKIKTRTKLEKMGLRPIPVYHPMSDGWDYFDYLAENYDRICFGNVVQAAAPMRKRLLATAFERQRKYPNLWIHMLGLTPSEICNAYPVNSCDSSTWLALVRWPDAFIAKSALKSFSKMPDGYAYVYGDSGSHKRARQLGGYESHMLMGQWRSLQADRERAFAS